jgi:Tol biopolymer transport system component
MSRLPSISADGLVVAFESLATNLVDGDTNGHNDVFVRDLAAHPGATTERVSVAGLDEQGNGDSSAPSISADGLYVAFQSEATTLVAGGLPGTRNVFRRHLHLPSTQRVSVTTSGDAPDGWSGAPSISADGRFVAFSSESTALVTGDTNGHRDVFLRDMDAGVTRIVSVAMGIPQAQDESYDPSISADGRYVSFTSYTDLVAPDSGYLLDVFVRDTVAGITERVSNAVGGGLANDESGYETAPRISANGRYIVFDSEATNLITGDTNEVMDIFLADRGTLSISVTRSPSSSTKTYRRSHGKVTFTLAGTVRDSRGVKIAGTRVYLQHSKNGRTGWHTAYTLTTNAAGKASKTITARKRSTVYYRWHVHSNDVRGGKTTGKQKVVVR